MRNLGRNGGYARNTRRRTAICSSSGISVLSETTLLEIFFRLSILSIMNCKLVCTAWYNLLRDSTFTNHYGRNSQSRNLVLPRPHKKGTSTYYPCFSFLEISENENFIWTKIYPKSPCQMSSRSSLSVVGSWNGLLCLEQETSSYITIYLNNPLMGECFALSRYERIKSCSYVHRLGFSQNCLKVMRIIFRRENNSLLDGRSAIFTVGVDKEWRSLLNISDLNSLTFDVFLNGYFHWIVLEKAGVVRIRTFDIGEEKVGQIPHPPCLEKPLCHNLVILGNRLCVVDVTLLHELALWTMKEYGVASSWTKDALFLPCVPTVGPFRAVKLVAILKNGDIIFVNYKNNSLVSYNHKQEVSTKMGFFDFQHLAPLTVTYTPSFLSIKEVIKGLN